METKSMKSNIIERRSMLAKIFGGLAGVVALGGFSNALAKVLKTGVGQEKGKNTTLSLGTAVVGEITIFVGSSVPSGWAICDGSLLSRTTYASLFSYIGATYGAGDGSTTFALPDLRGRVPIGMGQGSGLSNYASGQTGGEETHTLSLSEMATHNHSAAAGTGNGTSSTPQSNYFAVSGEGIEQFGTTANGSMNSGITSSAGSGGSHNNMQPFFAVNFIISIDGSVYP